MAVPARAGATGASGEPVVAGTSADVALLVTFIVLALVFSFLCSIAEAVLLSITPSYVEGLRAKRPRHAALLTRLKYDNLDRSLAAILTLNTIAHTVGAIGAGAKATLVFGSAWFGVFSAVMTLMILFLSEIVPKTIGALYWARLAGPTALFVRILIVVLYPLVWASERLTRLVSHGKSVHIFSRDELAAMTRVGEQTGHIKDSESRIIQNLLRFGSLKVTDIMTPRTVISALSEETTLDDAMQLLTRSPFSRVPVFRSDLDDVVGFILKDEVMLRIALGHGDEVLRSMKRRLVAVPETTSLSVLMDTFLKERQHIAVVIDEYGGTTGLVTLEDLVETLIGVEIVDETDEVEDMQTLARRLWMERARDLGIEPTAEPPPPAR